jgi:hypothetical protein
MRFSTLMITLPGDMKTQPTWSPNFTSRDKHYELAFSIVIVHISNQFIISFRDYVR